MADGWCRSRNQCRCDEGRLSTPYFLPDFRLGKSYSIIMKQLTQTLLLASVLATSAGSAVAQSTSPSNPDSGRFGHEGFGPNFAVVNDLQHLQRLYDLNGRESEMRDIYHDVLLKTQVPAIRQYVYEALARNLLRPTNVDQAITTIRTSLDEDLGTLAKHPSAP
jgi:hypothetical protein